MLLNKCHFPRHSMIRSSIVGHSLSSTGKLRPCKPPRFRLQTYRMKVRGCWFPFLLSLLWAPLTWNLNSNLLSVLSHGSSLAQIRLALCWSGVPCLCSLLTLALFTAGNKRAHTSPTNVTRGVLSLNGHYHLTTSIFMKNKMFKITANWMSCWGLYLL